jgi:hypothetical protein
VTVGRTMGGFQSGRMVTGVWLTPRYILDALGVFDLDPCAAPDPAFWPTARQHIAPPDNGLDAGWHGRVWLNPPYSGEARLWLAKLAAHGHGTALTFARTDTSWFADSVWSAASAALFLRGRIRFHRPDGTLAPDNGGAPSVLVAYGEQDAAILGASELRGAFVPLHAAPPSRVEAML